MSRSPSAEPRPPGAGVALLSVALIWGLNIPAMKYAIEHMHPFAFNALRLSLSALALGAMEWFERRGRPAPPTPWKRLIAVSLLMSGLYQILFVLGMERTTAGSTALLISSSPVWTALVARALKVEAPAAGVWLGLFLAFLGTALVTFSGGKIDLGAGRVAGNVLVLVASLAWATGTVQSRVLVRTLSPTRLAFLMTAVSLPVHLALCVPYMSGAFERADAVTWGCVAYAGVFSTGLAYALWNVGVQRVGASQTAVYTNLVPVIALIASWLALGEVPLAGEIGGGAAILAGLVLVRRARAR